MTDSGKTPASGAIQASPNDNPEPSGPSTAGGGYRWTICAVLFFAMTINYLDRAVITTLSPTLLTAFGWTKTQYGYVTNAFQIAYAIGLLLAGGIIDKIGTRKGFSISVIVWSAAGAAAGFASGLWTFVAARALLGLGEAGSFPAAVKSTAEWFPKKERALATGIFNSGTNVGAIAAPLLVAALARGLGWRWAFIITGAIGFLWVVLWMAVYRRPEEHPKVSRQELAYIQSEPEERVQSIPWASVIPHRQAWAFGVGKFITDPVWWFWLFWLGIFLKDQFKVDLKDVPMAQVVIYVAASFGSVLGGWLPGYLMKKHWSVNAARKGSMLLYAALVVPVIGALFTNSMWTAVGLIALAASAHQAWSANLFTLVSDMFPRKAVGSVVGLGGMLGAGGSVLLTIFVGPWLQSHKNSYLPFFLIAGCGYLIALALIQLLAPRLEPAKID